MLSVTEFVDFPGKKSVVVRAENLPVDDLVEFMDDCFTALGEAIRRELFTPAGAAFARFDTELGETVDVEAGFPVAEGIGKDVEIGKQRVIDSRLPAGLTAVTTYRGDYAGLTEAWESFNAELTGRGYQLGYPRWEFYDVGPKPGSKRSHFKTTLACPVTKSAVE